MNRTILATYPWWKFPNHRGFTLLELMIAVIIMGVMSAISIPSLVTMVDKAQYADARQQMGCAAKELTMINVEYGFYPYEKAENVIPDEVECLPTQESGNVPFDSRYDYENWEVIKSNNRVGSGSNKIQEGVCYIQITFLGKNQTRDSSTTDPPKDAEDQPGFYESTDNDDLIFSLGVQSQDQCFDPTEPTNDKNKSNNGKGNKK